MIYKLEDFKEGDLVVIDKKLIAYDVGINDIAFRKMQKSPQIVQKITLYDVIIRGYHFDPEKITAIITKKTNPEYFI